MAAVTPGSPPPAEVAIDSALVLTLLKEQHPDLADQPLQPGAEGWDNVTVRLGRALAVRLPRRGLAADLVLNEQRWLPALGAKLPLPIPVPVRVGRPSGEYPWHWSVVPWFSGMPALIVPLIARQASELGRFLRVLHAIELPEDPPTNPYRGGPLRAFQAPLERLDRFARRHEATTAHDDLHTILAAGISAPIDAPPVWLHGDLHAKNVISDGGRIAALIDWGDLCAGDPATDLAAVWNLFPPAAHPGFWQAYGDVSAETRLRAAAWAIHFGLMLWDSHHDADPAFADLAITALRRVAATDAG